jgi:hypothetical protein
MVTQQEARDAIARSVVNDGRLQDHLDSGVTVDTITQEADGGGSDAVKTLPLLLVVFDSSEKENYRNTELVGYKTNSDGERVAKIYEREWVAEARIELWTADRADNHDGIDTLSDALVSILYGYETRTSNDDFLDENGDPIEGLWHFSLGEGLRNDDTSQTPTVRRWEQIAEVYGAQRYVGEEQPPITSTNQTVQ